MEGPCVGGEVSTSFESKKVVLTKMLGDVAVVWERDYRAACRLSGERDSRWLETSESWKQRAHRLRSSPICDSITSCPHAGFDDKSLQHAVHGTEEVLLDLQKTAYRWGRYQYIPDS